MSSPEFKSEPQAISFEELFSTPEAQSAIERSVKAQVFDATHPDFIPDYKTSHTTNEAGERVFLTKEDEDFLNRPQADSVDLVAAHRKPSMNMDFMFAPAEQPEKENPIRPLSAIVKDLHAEKAHTVKRQTIKSDGTKSKRFKEVSAVYQENIDPLLDELAVRVALEKTDYSVKNASEDDTRLNTVLELQRRTGLSDEDAIEILDRAAVVDDVITIAENEIDEIISGEITNAMHALVLEGKNPHEYFRDTEGNVTSMYLEVDKKFGIILNSIESPVVRAKVLKDLNAQLDIRYETVPELIDLPITGPLPAPKPLPAPVPKPADLPKPKPVVPLAPPSASTKSLAPPNISTKADIPAPGKLPNSNTDNSKDRKKKGNDKEEAIQNAQNEVIKFVESDFDKLSKDTLVEEDLVYPVKLNILRKMYIQLIDTAKSKNATPEIFKESAVQKGVERALYNYVGIEKGLGDKPTTKELLAEVDSAYQAELTKLIDIFNESFEAKNKVDSKQSKSKIGSRALSLGKRALGSMKGKA